jgi:hypothetical protein
VYSLAIFDEQLVAGTSSAGVWRRPLSDMLTVDAESNSSVIPSRPSLSQNYPNPFNPATRITYQLLTRSHVTLKVIDILGREVATLVNQIEEPGQKTVTFDASQLPSGVYLYRLTAATYRETRQMLLIK